jgi:hypothetical protein
MRSPITLTACVVAALLAFSATPAFAGSKGAVELTDDTYNSAVRPRTAAIPSADHCWSIRSVRMLDLGRRLLASPGSAVIDRLGLLLYDPHASMSTGSHDGGSVACMWPA